MNIEQTDFIIEERAKAIKAVEHIKRICADAECCELCGFNRILIEHDCPFEGIPTNWEIIRRVSL